MLHWNPEPAAPAPPPAKPCIRDFAELVARHLPCVVVKLVSLDELHRRAAEITAEHPRFREEVPLVLALEMRRRARHHGLYVAGKPVPGHYLASDAYVHA